MVEPASASCAQLRDLIFREQAEFDQLVNVRLQKVGDPFLAEFDDVVKDAASQGAIGFEILERPIQVADGRLVFLDRVGGEERLHRDPGFHRVLRQLVDPTSRSSELVAELVNLLPFAAEQFAE